MTDIKSAIQNATLQNKSETDDGSIKGEVVPKSKSTTDKNQEESVKRRKGRPCKIHVSTKLHLLLENRGMTRRDLCNLIEEKYPEEPVSADAVSRIVSGNRKYYSTRTLFRICGALNITPNMALDYEEDVL